MTTPTDAPEQTVVDVVVDFAVIGAGAGGLAAAIRASELGMSTMVLEASDRIGGVTAYSGGHCYVPGNHLMVAEGHADDDEAALEYLRWVSGPQLHVDEALLESVITNARRVFAQLEASGVEFGIIPVADHFYPEAPGSRAYGRMLEPEPFDRSLLGEWSDQLWENPHFPAERGLSRAEVLGGRLPPPEVSDARFSLGEALVGALARVALIDRGVPIALTTRARSLMIDSGRVTGVRFDSESGSGTLTARRGVLVATGSYGSAGYARDLEGFPELHEASPPVAHGDNLTLADSSPAAVVRGGQPFVVLGFRLPGETHPGTDEPLYRQAFAATGRPHSIVVNSAGHRFGDESHAAYMTEAATRFDRATRGYPNLPSFLITDDRFRQRSNLGPLLADSDWPSDFVCADDPTELADRLGIDPDGLVGTIERFNAHAADGADPEFGRGGHPHAASLNGDDTADHPNIGPLEHGPFWGIPLVVLGVGIYSMGIWVDGSARARTADGLPVPGMYVTGNAAAYTEQLRYQGGYANTRNITLGVLAAEHASTKARCS